MRRRVLGLVLLGLGGLCLGAALAVRLFLAPALVSLPLDQEATSEASDDAATYLDLGELQEVRGPITARLTVQGDPSADEASDDVAVWNYGTAITDEDGELVTAPTEVVNCLDRDTAASVGCDARSINGEPVDIEGLTLTFPFDTEQRDYDLWNNSVREAVPARYDGEDEVEGVEVYRFVQSIPETVISQVEVPGTLAGESSGDTVTADVVYSSEREILVEPVSGKIVRSVEQPVTVLRGPSGDDGVTVLAADLGPSEEGVRTAAEGAAETRDQITLVQRTLPLALAGLGAVLLVAGVLLFLRSRQGGHRSAGPDTPQRAEPVTVTR
ncbi:DUF3068 domain-containing protein [Geodermatophilus sp. SYSU D00700]